jgi:glycosyltransferase involved in cell wall biosynthesis
MGRTIIPAFRSFSQRPFQSEIQVWAFRDSSMKVVQVNYSDIDGGAARAAYRIHHALRRHGVDSRMYVSSASAGDWTVQTLGGRWTNWFGKFRQPLAGLLTKAFGTENRVLFSPAIFPSRWPQRLNKSGADIIHLHWVAGEMMSVADIGRLHAPVVWTLHDMWGFCGAENYSEEFRWREGYSRHNRPAYESGCDLDRWTWRRKLKHWQRPMHIVAPSRWLADCARHSAIMQDWPVSIVPNPIDTEAWQLVNKSLARRILSLPVEGSLLLFGAMGGTLDSRKGFDLLKGAFDHLRGEMTGLELVILGQLEPREPLNLGFPIHYTGHLHDDISLCLYYSAADAVVVPSRQDNLPNIAVEALACGTPVVAFNICGLPDVVEHQKTGYLAQPFDTQDLARGIQWVLDDTERRAILSTQSRQAAVTRFSYPVVAEQYLQLYKTVGHL